MIQMAIKKLVTVAIKNEYGTIALVLLLSLHIAYIKNNMDAITRKTIKTMYTSKNL